MRRGKIQIERIDNTSSRQVTFTKRRKGLFKKAKELSILCEVDVGVIVFSTTRKLYEFANKSMKSLLEQYSSAKEQIPLLNPTLEANLWKVEAESLRRQLDDLTRSHRQMMGEEISELSIEDLENLVDQLEASSKALRARKVVCGGTAAEQGGATRSSSEPQDYDLFSPIQLQLSQPQQQNR
ncbi:hypothetical protein Nepgr_004882 [Nepenthes gracilis]|uniref:Uncharacterized protein n=1 Tax=Nepenthes gracilis TaxID=150966 RepID=A0AAD3XFP3_NEPGR|nr:hypothetical protein Nepgr_004882 [Nepenthes gracilis]